MASARSQFSRLSGLICVLTSLAFTYYTFLFLLRGPKYGNLLWSLTPIGAMGIALGHLARAYRRPSDRYSFANLAVFFAYAPFILVSLYLPFMFTAFMAHWFAHSYVVHHNPLWYFLAVLVLNSIPATLSVTLVMFFPFLWLCYSFRTEWIPLKEHLKFAFQLALGLGALVSTCATLWGGVRGLF